MDAMVYIRTSGHSAPPGTENQLMKQIELDMLAKSLESPCSSPALFPRNPKKLWAPKWVGLMNPTVSAFLTPNNMPSSKCSLKGKAKRKNSKFVTMSPFISKEHNKRNKVKGREGKKKENFSSRKNSVAVPAYPNEREHISSTPHTFPRSRGPFP